MFEEKNHKKRKNCEIGSNQGSMEDMISKLPEDFICCHILSRLRTVDAVKTSALSTKWRNLWKRVPHLGLHSRRFSTSNDFVTFITKFLYFHKDSSIRKFQLRIFEPNYQIEWLHGLHMNEEYSYVTHWIDDVLSRHKIQHLDFSYGNYICTNIRIPLSLYTCETLVHLRLVGVVMDDSEFVSLSCLKSIYFRLVTCLKKTIPEKLISNSPVLKDVTILKTRVHNDDAKPLHLRSHTLEKIYVDGMGYGIREVVIDAPLLQCLKFKLSFHERCRTMYYGVSPKVQVDVKLIYFKFPSNPDGIRIGRDHLSNILIMVKDLVITKEAFKHIYQFSNSNLASLPQFGYMSCLTVNLCASKLRWFPTFLDSCPNLKSLNMRWHADFKKRRNIRFESVPKCLLSSLECVDIKTMVSKDAIEVKVVKYFLDNAVILKKLALKLVSHPRKDDIFNEIQKFPRRSITSQLEFL